VTAAVGAESGAVYDRGYRPYDGPRGGRSAARAALYRASLRRALGLRRSWRQKVAPFVLLGIAVIPAIVNVGVQYLTRNTVASDVKFFSYREYLGVSNTLLVFVALTAPDLMCPDRRQHVLPLYFARPLTGIDYVVAKAGAMLTILFAFSLFPQIVLYVGNMLVSKDGSLGYLQGHTDVLWKVPIGVAILSVFYALIGTAIASLTSRRINAGASIVGLFLVTSVISGVIVGDSERPGYPGSPGALFDLLSLPSVLRDLVFLGHVGTGFPLSGVDHGGTAAILVYAAIVAVTVVTLLLRYNEVER
jgi:ABC-2 type transport system permease protein